MNTETKLIKNKLGLLNLADYSGDMHPVIPVICTQFGG